MYVEISSEKSSEDCIEKRMNRSISIYILDYIEGVGYNPTATVQAATIWECRGRRCRNVECIRYWRT